MALFPVAFGADIGFCIESCGFPCFLSALDSSTSTVVMRYVRGVGGEVWVDKQSDLHLHTQTPNLSSSRLQTWKHASTVLHQAHTVD